MKCLLQLLKKILGLQAAPPDKFANLVYRPEGIIGDPDDIVDIQWEFDLDTPDLGNLT